MSDLLSIGASGVRAYQSALTTTSENIANVGTAGYVRRTADLREVGAAAGIGGYGATASGTIRAADEYRNADVRAAGSDLARSETGIVWLDRLDTALSGQGLSDRITSFFNAANQVAADPSATAPRAVFIEQARSAAEAFAATGAAIDRTGADLDQQGTTAAADLTRYSASLAQINNALGRTQPGTSGQAALLDQRDQLLDAVSGLADVAVTIDPIGRATVHAGGTGGALLVNGDQSASVTYARNADGAVAFTASLNGERSAIAVSGGAFAGIAEGAQRVADARARIDTLAQNFADGVNQVQAQGRDLSGNPGQPLFSYDPANPSALHLALEDPRGVAAAAIGGGPRDNGNLTALAALRTSGGFETEATSLVATNGAALAARLTVADAQGAIREQALADRSGLSGVDLDHEAVDLIKFQQAYQASSRVIQVARETLQTLFQIN